MKLQNAASVLALLSAASHVSGFTVPSHFVSYGAATLTQSVSPELQTIRADVAVEGQKKKKKKNKKKNKEPIASPYTVAQGAATQSKKEEAEAPALLESVEAPTGDEPELVEALAEAKVITVEEPVAEAVEEPVVEVESEAERLTREAREKEIEAERAAAERFEAAKRSQAVEAKQRALLVARLEREVREAIRVKEEAERAAAQQAAAEQLEAAKRRQEAEAKQRALLVARLEREDQVREAIRAKEEAIAQRKAAILEARSQPKSPEVEKALQETYAAIDDLGERAFAILVDLGLVQISPDPSAPDYDN